MRARVYNQSARFVYQPWCDRQRDRQTPRTAWQIILESGTANGRSTELMARFFAGRKKALRITTVETRGIGGWCTREGVGGGGKDGGFYI